MEWELVKLEIHTPREFVEPLRDALNALGACRVGAYDHVVSFGETQGFWRPLEGSHPYDGSVGELSQGTECRMDVRCPAALVERAVAAIRAIHPYEEPLINVVPLLNGRWETI